jgi:ArsR family transcriptional regulator, cadmium/lead-responsive transcriptional repressor
VNSSYAAVNQPVQDLIALYRYDRCMAINVRKQTDREIASALFRSLAEPKRLEILQELLRGEARVVDLVETLGGSQSNISAHLACLKDCGMVVDRPEGRQTFYSIAHREIVDLLRAAEHLLAINGQLIEVCPTSGINRRRKRR